LEQELMELGPESSGCGATALFDTRIVVLDDCAYAQREQDAARTTPLTSWRVEPTAIVEPLPGVMTKLCKPIHTHEAGNREASTGVTETSREQLKAAVRGKKGLAEAASSTTRMRAPSSEKMAETSLGALGSIIVEATLSGTEASYQVSPADVDVMLAMSV
jgi:hypothetical protein